MPGVTSVALILVAVTLVGILAAGPLTRSVGRTLVYITLLLSCTLTWWLVDQPLEGRTFIVVSPTHGFTFGDTLGLPALVVSGVLMLLAIRRRASLELSTN